jgi:hypothetical protein
MPEMEQVTTRQNGLGFGALSHVRGFLLIFTVQAAGAMGAARFATNMHA